MDDKSWARSVGNDRVRVAVRVQPRASRDRIDGVADGRLRVRLQAPPVEGAANAALCRFLAKALGVAKSKARIVAGAKSREKTVEIDGVKIVQIQALEGDP